MSTPYFQLLGHVALAVHTCETNAEVRSALESQGFGESNLETARRLLEEGEALPTRRDEEVGDERIAEHAVHSSATEVEMWMQTAEFRLKKAVDDEAVLATAFGEEIHSDDHVIEVVARCLRMMGMIRTHPTLHEQFGTDRSVKDLLIRGNTLLSKLLDAGDKWLSPGHAGDPEAEVFDDIESSRRSMIRWLQNLDEVATLLADGHAALLGELGYVPDDVGLPVGGTGYSITLHERSHREPPDPNEEPKGDPGWTIGRQGQNNENMGEGWVEPSFD